MVQLTRAQRSEQNVRFEVLLEDGATVEAVLYRENSLCISCQVGCAVGCPFCASGAFGLTRPLSFEELTGQVEAVLAEGAQLKKVTLSGVGEPLHNRHLLPFLDWCRERRLAPSLTTSGGPLERLVEAIHAPHNGLTVSVHAGDEATRARAVPRGPALDPLFETLAQEVPRLSRTRQKKIALAYLMIAGLNDSDDELDAFAARAAPLGRWVHLYAYNSVPTSDLAPVGRARYDEAYSQLTAAGLRVRMSCQARVEDNGGCGTLVALRRVDTPGSDVLRSAGGPTSGATASGATASGATASEDPPSEDPPSEAPVPGGPVPGDPCRTT